jgi:hypothetical protein
MFLILTRLPVFRCWKVFTTQSHETGLGNVQNASIFYSFSFIIYRLYFCIDGLVHYSVVSVFMRKHLNDVCLLMDKIAEVPCSDM